MPVKTMVGTAVPETGTAGVGVGILVGTPLGMGVDVRRIVGLAVGALVEVGMIS